MINFSVVWLLIALTKENLFKIDYPKDWTRFSWNSLAAELDNVRQRSSLSEQQKHFGAFLTNPLPVPTEDRTPCFDTLYLDPDSASFPRGASSIEVLAMASGGDTVFSKFSKWVQQLTGGPFPQATKAFLGALYNVQLAGKTKVNFLLVC